MGVEFNVARGASEAHDAVLWRDGFLTFGVGPEEYAIDILKVQEIRSFERVTAIPNTPPHVRGVLNLRGSIIPIIDLRTLFGMAPADTTIKHVVIVLNLSARVVGVVADHVSDVLHLTADQIQAPPRMSASLDLSYLIGMATLPDRMVAICDLDLLLASDDTSVDAAHAVAVLN